MKKLHIEHYFGNHIKVYSDLQPKDIEEIAGVCKVDKDLSEGYLKVMIDKRQATYIVEESIKNLVFPNREKLGWWKRFLFDIRNEIV